MGYTCESLGKLINVQKSAVSKYERGDIQPSKDVLIKMAQILNCSTDYLYGITNSPNPPNIVTQENFIYNKTNNPTPPDKKNHVKPEPDIKWGDFGISFYEGNDKKLTQKQKDKIAKLVQIAVMDDDYWENELGNEKKGNK